MATQDILVRLRALGAAAFQRDMDRSAKSVEGVGTKSEKTGKSIKDSAKKWAAFTVAGVGAGQVMTDAVKNAVNLGEEVNKTAVVFRGPGAKSVLDWSKSSASALGVSREQALASAAQFGNMLIPMGFARDRAAAMSKQMVQLGGDMASFNNASPEETLAAIQSGLAGETEPLRKFGVFLSAARVQSQAMSMGLVKATKDTDKIKAAQTTAAIATDKYRAAVKKYGKDSLQARQASVARQRSETALQKAMAGSVPKLNAAQQAQATYALILKDSKDAQGDFARTSDSLANRQRILRAQYANITATIGQKLLPVISFLLNNIKMVTAVVGLGAAAWGLYKTVLIATRVQAFLTGDSLAAMRIRLIALSVAQKISAAAQWLLNAAMLALPIVAIIAGIVALGVAFVIAYKKVGWFRDAVNAVFNWIKTNWPLIVAVLTGPIGIATLAIIKNFDKIKKAASTAVSWIAARFRDLINFFKRLPGAILSAIGDIGGKIKSKFESIKGGGVPFVPGLQHGGTIRRGGTVLVGETGPELLRLPSAATVAPLPAGALAGAAGPTTARFYLDRRLVATAVAQADADQRARR
jgi:hypothetical protein